MVSTFTTNKNIEKPGHNDYPNTWDVPVNADWDDIDTAFGGTLLLNATGLSGAQALTVTQTRPPSIQISGAPTAAITYTVPAGVGGVWIVRNTTTGGFNVGIASAAGGSTILIPASSQLQVWCDGTATGMLLVQPAFPGLSGATTFMVGNTVMNFGVITDLLNTGSIGAADWIVELSGSVLCQDNNNAAGFAIGIFDGSAYIISTSGFTDTATRQLPITIAPVRVTLTAPTTFTLRGLDFSNNGIAVASDAGSLAANKATWLTWTRVG